MEMQKMLKHIHTDMNHMSVVRAATGVGFSVLGVLASNLSETISKRNDREKKKTLNVYRSN